MGPRGELATATASFTGEPNPPAAWPRAWSLLTGQQYFRGPKFRPSSHALVDEVAVARLRPTDTAKPFCLAVEFEFRVLTLNLMAPRTRNLSLGDPPVF